jgi:fructan beta-fructosidase
VALPGMPFNQMMGLPVVLTLHSTSEGPRLFVRPVHELESLRDEEQNVGAAEIAEGQNPLEGFTADLAEIEVEFKPGSAKQVVFNLRGTEVVYDVQAGTVSCLGKQASLAPADGKVRLHFYVDRASIDIFGGDGELYMPMGNTLPPENRSFSMTTRGGTARLDSLKLYKLKSAWPAPAARRP